MTTSLKRLQFELPDDRSASEPPEARGLRRDQVKLLVAGAESIAHTSFSDVGNHLIAGDLLVVNTSPTMPAAVSATMRGREIAVHFSTKRDWLWTIELREPNAGGPVLDAVPNEVVRLAGGSLRLVRPSAAAERDGVRLWRVDVSVAGGVRRHLRRNGRPIRYHYVTDAWPLHQYQTVFADRRQWPGSAEMASAARPFTPALLAQLRRVGVQTVPIALHAGVSSQEAHEFPQPERYTISVRAALSINRARSTGGRVIAVGTTVARALETVADRDGTVRAGDGWTDLVLGPDRPSRGLDGIITGWHPPEASHLQLLEAVVGRSLVHTAYEAALAGDYLWHEFGDSCLFLPTTLR